MSNFKQGSETEVSAVFKAIKCATGKDTSIIGVGGIRRVSTFWKLNLLSNGEIKDET